MQTPFGTCGHTHYEGGPPCIHSAYLQGVEDGRVLPEFAVVEIGCEVCGWDFGYENDIGDLLPAWEWHLTDKRHMQAVREEALAALTQEAQEDGLPDATDRPPPATRVRTDDHACTYVTISDRPVARTDEVSYGVMVDRDEDGNIVGVQVLK